MWFKQIHVVASLRSQVLSELACCVPEIMCWLVVQIFLQWMYPPGMRWLSHVGCVSNVCVRDMWCAGVYLVCSVVFQGAVDPIIIFCIGAAREPHRVRIQQPVVEGMKTNQLVKPTLSGPLPAMEPEELQCVCRLSRSWLMVSVPMRFLIVEALIL